jgi:hypothetical protein
MNVNYLAKKRIIEILHIFRLFEEPFMDIKKILREENKYWHEDHLTWIQEVEQWQHETRRLLALLYLLERALPEHSSILNKHATLIEKHEQQVNNYECGLDEHCTPNCPSFITQEQQTEFHQTLSKLHDEAKQEHLKLKRSYSEKMDRFRSLVLALLEEC